VGGGSRRAPGGRGLAAVPSECSGGGGRRLPFLRRHGVESADRCEIPQGSRSGAAAARRPRTTRVLPHVSRRSTSRLFSTDESVAPALVSERPSHDPSMGFDPPRGHVRTRWCLRSPAGPIPPNLAQPKPHRNGVCPRRMSQPLLAADLRGFLTSKNGFVLGSRLVPKKKPPAPECGWPFSKRHRTFQRRNAFPVL
jgi:hypothetical protein